MLLKLKEKQWCKLGVRVAVGAGKLGLLVKRVTVQALAAAQPRCDPITEYEDKGECCKRCGPGTSLPPPPARPPPLLWFTVMAPCFSGTHMSPLGSCLRPACQPCESGEYQDQYTKDITCSRQQSCDPSKTAAAGAGWVGFRVLTFRLSSSPLQTKTLRTPNTTPRNEPPACARRASTAPLMSASPACRTRPANRDTASDRRVSQSFGLSRPSEQVCVFAECVSGSHCRQSQRGHGV